MENTKIFNALDYFMLRVPLLPLEFYQEVFSYKNEKNIDLTDKQTEKIVQLIHNPVIREVIASTSISLLESLDKLVLPDDLNKNKKVVFSFIKYLIRMSTRATPFGTLAGVTAGAFDQTTQMKLKNLNVYHTRARPDMEWLMKFISKLEQRSEVMNQLKVISNSAILHAGNRLEIPYISQYGEEHETQHKGMECISIRATEVVLYALEQAKEGIVFEELVKKVQQIYPAARLEKISRFVGQLFQSQFLLSELRPTLMINQGASPLEYIIEKLKNIKSVEQELSNLKEIDNLLTLYDEQKLGQGTKLFLAIVKKMNALENSKNPVQIDLAVESELNKLTKRIGEDLAEAAEVLWRLSPADPSTAALNSYRNLFIEKYGTCQEIPVLELLDEERGLGAPATYNFPTSRLSLKSTKKVSAVTKLERFLLEKIPQTMINQDQEIEITQEIIEKLEPVAVDKVKVPTSLELYCSIVANSAQAIDAGDYEIALGFNTGSNGAGKTFGRFVDVLPQEYRKKHYRINELEKQFLSEEVITAELVYMPYAGRSGNVVISENIRDYEIAINTNSSKNKEATLDISDLVIGVENNHFYVRSRTLGKIVMVTTGHMLNMLNAPNVYRFLLEACQDDVRNWSPLHLGRVAELPYIPRIRYKKVILSPANWKLSWQILCTKKDLVTINNFPELIQKWRQEWQVPQFVFLTEFDNRILLDLEHPMHLEILFEELSHKPDDFKATLLEMPGKFTDHWLTSPKGSYLEEIVVPLLANQEKHKRLNNKIAPKARAAEQLRIRYPGSDWLYVKLYGNSNREEEFIAFALKTFCHKVLNEEQLVEEWFFIRYADPKPHFRVRFRGRPEVLTSKLLPVLHQWWCQLNQEGLLSNAVVDTYEREIERYGGTTLIADAEKLFYWDSVVASDLLFIKRAGEPTIDLEVMGVVSIIHMLTSIGWGTAQQIDWLNTFITAKEHIEDFHKKRKTYMYLGDSTENWLNLRKQPHGEYIYNSFQQRGQQIKKLVEQMIILEQNQALTNSQSDIIGSLVHMHCNRLFGTDREKEKLILAITRHTLYNLKQFKLYAKDKDKVVKKIGSN